MFKWKEGQQDVIHHTNIKRGITSSFARALKVLQQKHLQFNEEEFIYSNDASNNLCNCLEAAFLHGLKDSVAHKLTAYVGLTAAPDSSTLLNFWSVVTKFTHSDVVTQLQGLTQINTEIGLCRAWVRLALNDGLMESYLHSMIVDTKTLKNFYHSYSYLRDHEQPGILKNYLTGLMSLDFKLSFNSSVLNHWNNSTLQLIGSLESHPAPAPTVRQTGWAHTASVQQEDPNDSQATVSTVRSVHSQNEAPEDVTRTQDVVNVDNVPAGRTQDVVDVDTVAAEKRDTVSGLSSAGFKGSSSHVSFPDPDVKEVSRPWTSDRESCDSSAASSLQYTADVYDSSENSGVSTHPQSGVYSGQVTYDVREKQDLPTVGPAVVHVEATHKSQVIVDETVFHLDNATPPRPRSRRVGEEDIHVLSSSLSPPHSRDSTPSHSANNQSDENQSIVPKAPLSPRRHFNQSSNDRRQTSPKRNRPTQIEEQSQMLSLHPDTHQTSSDIYKVVSSTEIFSSQDQLDHEIVLRTHKGQKTQVLSEAKNNQALSAGGVKQSQPPQPAGDRSILSDVSFEKQTDRQQRQPAVHESSTVNRQNVVDRDWKSSSVPNQNRLSAHSKGEENYENNANERNVRGLKHPHDSTVSQPADFDSMTTGHPGERTSGMVITYGETSQRGRDIEEAEAALEGSLSPSRFGNSLGSLSGWSSEIESKVDLRRRSVADKNRESFATMLHAYAPASNEGSYTPTLIEVIQALPCEADGNSVSGDQKSEDRSPTRNSDNSQSSRMYFLFHVPREHGLSHQNFACKGCLQPIGIIYGQPLVCEFDGGLYCQGCHDNKEAYIPSLILYDWDFRKKKVCDENYKFLQELEDQAVYDVEELNPKLYAHVPELQELKLLRQQLCFLKSYLFTCSQKVAESLRQKVWPREHLYDRRDLYSVTDFLQVQSGTLQKLVKDVVKFSSQHVYDCVLCSQKGFVCEICRNPQVIYPFEVNTTVRCQVCKQVYHQSCKTDSQPCPKCERWGRHISNSSISEDHPEDYGMSPVCK